MQWNIVRLDATGSTNDDARQFAMEGAPHGTVIVAESQSSGRGRRGSQWISPPGRNLICSLIWRPTSALETWPRLTHAVAVAIAESLEQLGLHPQIKWPNDIYLSGRKVCGILLESAGNAHGMFVVIGFGLNVNLRAEEFPEELTTSATSLQIETERVWDRDELLRTILTQIELRCAQSETDFPSLLALAESRSFLSGHAVSLQMNGEEERGIVRGLSGNGGLLFEDVQGNVREILTADLVRRV